ncbi:helix-turn-helix transcriptional regulator [Comamonas testosteroni]
MYKNLLLIPDKIRQLRLRRGRSQRTVAERADVSQSVLCAIENGRRVAGLGQVERLGQVLATGSEEIEQLKGLAAHDQIVDLVAQRYGEQSAEMVSLVLQAKAALSEREMMKITSLIQECITAKSLLENPRSELKMSP